MTQTAAQPPPDDPRRALASVSVLLEHPDVQALCGEFSHPVVRDAIRGVLDAQRRILAGGASAPDASALVAEIRAAVRGESHDRLRRVVNATGIILHTGLGRAALPTRAAAALGRLDACCNLQIDLATGTRGKRNHMTERLLVRLTGAEDAMVVNNNAAATLLILAALCPGKEVVVSRGQLIEIGGSFRLPDCVHQGGAILVEVGTTNKTHLRDYEAAITENSGALMRVNPSNYRIVGFSQEVPVAALVELGRKHNVPVIDDLGCGALIDLAQFGLPHEPTVQESVAAGADVVCFSADKLIGGPQAGIIVGRRERVQAIRKHPLSRMLRVGKLTDTALEQTLRLFLDPESLVREHPTLRMLTLGAPALKRRAGDLLQRLNPLCAGLELCVKPAESRVGGGSLPDTALPTFALSVRSTRIPADRLWALLRMQEPPVIARVKDDEVLLDLRTVLEGEEPDVIAALAAIAAQDAKGNEHGD